MSVSSAELWVRPARRVLAGGWALGVVLLAVGWWGVAGEATVDDQFRWFGLGLMGLLLPLAISAAWLMAGRRAVALRARATVPVPGVAARPVPGLVAVDSERLVSAPSMRYFHRASCALARGKATQPATRADHQSAGRAACGVCNP